MSSVLVAVGAVFQSTPPVAGRRCAALLAMRVAQRKVSIHASRCREAMHRPIRHLPVRCRFQSTPPVAGRRCNQCPTASYDNNMFQSTPPVAGRRCIINCDALDGWQAVSIHASRCREAMQQHGADDNDRQQVSIHASRCREAMRFMSRNSSADTSVSIHASRCREAMRRGEPPEHVSQLVSIHASRCREAMPAPGM